MKIIITQKRIQWDNLDLSDLKASSIKKYKGLMIELNNLLSDKPDKDTFFYWYLFTEPDNQQKIIDYLKHKYSPKSIPVYINIITTCIGKIPTFPALANTTWTKILNEQRLIASTITNEDKHVIPWSDLQTVLKNALTRIRNHNIRIISILFLNGFVLRPEEIILTMYQGDANDTHHNHINLDNGIWIINAEATKTFARSFIIPKNICEQIRRLVNPTAAFLLSRINGSPYAGWGSFNTTWKKSIGVDAYDFRRSFSTWFNTCNLNNIDMQNKLTHILGHSTKVSQLYYTLSLDTSQPLDFLPAIYANLHTD